MESIVEKMDDIIQEYCDELGHCEPSECIIYDECDEVGGNFENNPEKCAKACKKVLEFCERQGNREVNMEDTKPDMVNHPPHYTNSGMECIDEMILIFGKEAVRNFCLCNAWKYRKRAIYKNGEEDMKKSDWYINKYKELNNEHTKPIHYDSTGSAELTIPPSYLTNTI